MLWNPLNPWERARAIERTRRLSLGVATLWDGNEAYACALPLWCRSARAFGIAAHLNVSIVLLQRDDAPQPEGCNGANRYWPQDVAEATAPYIDRHRRTHYYVQDMASTLMKLGVFALTQFDLILYAPISFATPHATRRLDAAPWRPMRYNRAAV